MYEFILANRVHHELEPGILVNISKLVVVRVEESESGYTAVVADVDLGKKVDDCTGIVLGYYSTKARATVAFDDLMVSLNDEMSDGRIYRMMTDAEAQRRAGDAKFVELIDRCW